MRTDKLNLMLKRIMGESLKKLLVKLLFPWRNNFILFNLSNRAKKNVVNLNYWDESSNLGDAISPVIVGHMLKEKGIDANTPVGQTKHLYAVGSILTAGIQDAVVWGSGILNSDIIYRLKCRKFDVRAVRGPVTGAILRDFGHCVPDVYGDPAVFLPEVYMPVCREKKARYGLVLHKDEVSTEISDADVMMIDICRDDYKSFVDEITSVDIVISSSLHGIILAEAYGVPAVLLRPKKDMLKYCDYYFGTGRMVFPVAETITEAKLMQPAKLPEFEPIRAALRNAFPYDMYR